MENKEVPKGVKITSFLYYITAVLVVVQTIIFAFNVKTIVSFVLDLLPRLGLAVLAVFIGMGLWNGKKWAKMVTLIFSGLVFTYLVIFSLLGLFTVFKGLIQLSQTYSFSEISSGMLGNIPYISIIEYLVVFVVTGFVFFYLLRNKEAKEFLSSK